MSDLYHYCAEITPKSVCGFAPKVEKVDGFVQISSYDFENSIQREVICKDIEWKHNYGLSHSEFVILSLTKVG